MREKKIKKMFSLLPLLLTLSPLQGFSSRETDFHFHQFLSNFLKYSSSNFPSSHLYNIFAINFPSNSPLLKSFFLSGAVHTRVEVRRMDSEMSGLVEQP